MKRPRTRCRECGRFIAVDKRMRVNRHKRRKTPTQEKFGLPADRCPGSRKLVLDQSLEP